MGLDPLRAEQEQFFTRHFVEHGATARGVDWPNENRQAIAFDQVLRIADDVSNFSLIDYGCGYGGLVPHLAQRGLVVDYVGYDLSEVMVAYAQEQFGDTSRFVSDESVLEPADYVVASGVFNLRFEHGNDEWTEHILATLERFDALSVRGFAFNLLTSYSDPERMREDLYYGDGAFFFDHCKRRFSRNVALLHDYGFWEWTILVRKDRG